MRQIASTMIDAQDHEFAYKTVIFINDLVGKARNNDFLYIGHFGRFAHAGVFSNEVYQVLDAGDDANGCGLIVGGDGRVDALKVERCCRGIPCTHHRPRRA